MSQIKLLNKSYRTNPDFYSDFLNLDDKAFIQKYASDDVIDVPRELLNIKFPIYFPPKRNLSKDFPGFIKLIIDKFLVLGKPILFDFRFWISLISQYHRKHIIELYPEIMESEKSFSNIIFKKFGWENYIYKSVATAYIITENCDKENYDKYINLVMENLDLYNYLLKYNIFYSGSFIIKVLDIIYDNGIGAFIKAKIKNRPDLKKNNRYGRRVIYELNKSYPSLMSPMVDKELLEEYFLKYLEMFKSDQDELEYTDEVDDIIDDEE